jgi:hypothetical protein
MYTLYMALHITNPDVEHEVRELASLRGMSITDLIGSAVKTLKIQQSTEVEPKPTAQELLAFLDSFPSTPIDYSLSEDEILGYSPKGYSE